MKKLSTLILLLFLVVRPAFAESERKKYLFMPPLDGLNTSISPLILNPKALTKADNVLYDHIGTRKKRGGITYLNPTDQIAESSGSNTFTGIYDFRSISTTGAETRKLVGSCDAKLYKMDDFDGEWDMVSSGPFTVNKQTDFSVLRKADTTQDAVVVVNGAETPHVWKQGNSSTDVLTGTPTGVDFYPSCIEAHANRLWAGGVPSYPYRLFYSAGYTYDDWNTADDAGYIDVIDNFGGKITGILGNFYSYNLIFTDYSLWGISGTSDDDFALAPILPNVGAVNNKCIVSYAGDVFWVSYQGIHQLSTTEKYGDIEATYLSAPIQKDFDNLAHGQLANCCGKVWTPLNYIIWSFTESGQTTNTVCFVYDYTGKRWSKWNNIDASCFAVVKNSVGSEELLAGNYDGYVNRLNRTTYNDNGAAYKMSFSTPYITFGDATLNKLFKELFMFLKPQGSNVMDVYYRIGNQGSELETFTQARAGGVFGDFRFDIDSWGGGTLIPRSQSISGSGGTLQLTVEQEDLNVGCDVYGYGVELVPGKTEYGN